jgi:hypothetical protein
MDYSRTVWYALFLGKTKQDRFCHILRYLHFTANRDKPDKRDDNSDRLWKMRTIFGMFNYAHAKYYSPIEQLTKSMFFKGKVVFKQYIPKKHKHGIKIYKLCDSKGYMYDMRVYSGKDRTYATDTMTAMHTTVVGLTRRVENVGQKLYNDNFFSSDLFNDLYSRKINCCGTVRLNQKGMEFRKTMKLTKGDIRTGGGDLTATM